MCGVVKIMVRIMVSVMVMMCYNAVLKIYQR